MYKIKSFFRRFFAIHKKWYKRWWIWIIAILIITVFISIPFIINEAYKADTGYVTLWDASDMLADILGHTTTEITERYYVKKDTSRLNGITDGFEI